MKNLSNLKRKLKLYTETAQLLGIKNTLICGKRYVLQKIGGWPKCFAIEPSSFCNLDCAFCVTKELKVWEHREKNFLSFDEFKKLIDEVLPFCYRLDFAFCGEPLMNKEVHKMFKYASDKRMLTSLFTNATFLTDENIDKLLDSGLSRIFTAFESFNKEIYEGTKKGAKFDVTRKNIEKLIKKKEGRGQKFPQIIIRMVVTKKNANEVDDFIKHVKEMGADAAAIKPLGIWPQGSKKYRETMLNEFVTVDHPMTRHTKDKNGNIIPMPKEKPCTSIDSPVLTSDGSIFLCWYDALGESKVGNINKESFKSIWKRTEKFRKKQAKEGNAYSICENCLGRGAAGKIIKFK